MRYPINWQDDNEIRKLFSYQARVGFAPKFGTRPIGWYQIHQHNVYNYITEVIRDMKQGHAEIRVKRGMLQLQGAGGKWFNNISAYNVYQLADMKSRKGELI